MRHAALRTAVVLLCVSAGLDAAEPGGADDVARVARRFGEALTAERPADLRGILPEHGKVRVTLLHMGPEEGFFGASQVEALFRDFLAAGSVDTFETVRLEGDGTTSALVSLTARITDRNGHAARVGIHLALQREAGRWVLREIKERQE